MQQELEKLLESANEQATTIEGLFASSDRSRLTQRPEPKKWSVVEHLEHLNVTNELYLAKIAEAVDRAREAGWRSEGPFGGPWFANKLIASQEPPPKMRLKTFKVVKPAPHLDADAVLESFRRRHESYRALMKSADGLDLGRATFRSPLLALVKLSAAQGFRLIDAHNRRHIWHMDRTLSQTDASVA